jgi:hypothetical protein
MIYKIYNTIFNQLEKIYEFIKDIYELPGNIKQLIKEHEYYKTEFSSLLKKYEELSEIHKQLLRKIT